jgi:hypothetical protein
MFFMDGVQILSGKRCELTNKWIQGHCRAGMLCVKPLSAFYECDSDKMQRIKFAKNY